MFKKENIDRIVQLFQRSNQFNLTTIRYSYADIEKLINNKNFTFQFSFKDKFSDYGIISLIVCKKNKNKMIIESWVMSCRVLNRTLENFIINYLINFAKKNKLHVIIGNYKKTYKNSLVSKIYDELGFKLVKKSVSQKEYIYDIKSFNKLKSFVKGEN
jgi:FkbH-like protein